LAETLDQFRKNFITRALTYVPHITGGLVAANLLGWGWGYYLAQHYTCRDCKMGDCPWWLDIIQTLPRWIPKVESYLVVLVSTQLYSDYYDKYCLLFTFGHGVFLVNTGVAFVVYTAIVICFWHIQTRTSSHKSFQISLGINDIRILFCFGICCPIMIYWIFWGTTLRSSFGRRSDSVMDWWFTFHPFVAFAFLFGCVAYLVSIMLALVLRNNQDKGKQ
jgi:hypothetical protein